MTAEKTQNKPDKQHSTTGSHTRLFTGLDVQPVKLLPGLGVRIAVFSFIWWGLSAGIVDQEILIFFIIMASALLSILLVPPQKISIKGLLLFVPFFVRFSVMGGIDVAARAFQPSMPLKTGFLEYHLRLTHPTARVLFVWIVSLLPGTASVSLQHQTLHVHVLDQTMEHASRLNELEEHIAMIFKTQKPV